MSRSALRLFVLLSQLSLSTAACRSSRTVPAPGSAAGPGDAGPGSLAATVVMGDHRLASQLTHGFHRIELGQWRWTEKNFSVKVGVPKSAPSLHLKIKLTVPRPVIERSQTVTLFCEAGGASLAPETYGQAADYIYQRELAATAAESLLVDCHLDNVIPPTKLDTRELGIIVWDIGLTTGS